MFPVTRFQLQYWLLEQAKPSHPGLVTPLYFEIKGKVDLAIFKRAFLEYVNDYHVGLGGAFSLAEETLVWEQKANAGQLEFFEINDLNGAQPKTWLVDKILDAKLDTKAGVNLHTVMLSVADDYHLLGLSIYHLFTDTVTGQFFVQTLSHLYQFYVGAREDKPTPPPPYEVLLDEMRNPEKNMFLQQVTRKDAINLSHAIQSWPGVRDNPTEEGLAHLVQFDLGQTFCQEISKIARQQGCVFWMVLLAVYAKVLQKWTGEEQVSLSFPVNIRPSHLRNVPGCWANHALFEIDLSQQLTLGEALTQIKQYRKYQREHHFAEQKQAHVAVSDENKPRCSFTVAFLNLETLDFPGCEVKGFFPTQTSTFYDADLSFELYQGSMRIQIKMDAKKFDRWEAEAFAAEFRFYLHLWLKFPTLTSAQLPLWRSTLGGNAPIATSMNPGSRFSLNGQKWSVTDLQQKIDKYRGTLRTQGLTGEKLAIYLPRTLERLAIIYAAWAEVILPFFIPLQANDTEIKGLCAESQVNVILSEKTTQNLSGLKVLSLDALEQASSQEPSLQWNIPSQLTLSNGGAAQTQTVLEACQRMFEKINLGQYSRVIYALPQTWDEDLFVAILGLFYSGEIVFCENITQMPLQAADLVVANFNLCPVDELPMFCDGLSVMPSFTLPQMNQSIIWQMLGYPVLGYPLSCRPIKNPTEWPWVESLLPIQNQRQGFIQLSVNAKSNQAIFCDKTAQGLRWLGVGKNLQEARWWQKLQQGCASWAWVLGVEAAKPNHYTIILYLFDSEKRTEKELAAKIKSMFETLAGFQGQARLFIFDTQQVQQLTAAKAGFYKKFTEILFTKSQARKNLLLSLINNVGQTLFLDDKSAKPDLEFSVDDEDKLSVREPLGPVEYQIWILWRDCFSLAKPQMNQNLLQMGITSLKWLALLSQLNQKFNLRLTIQWLLEHPTIALQAKAIQAAKEDLPAFNPLIKLNQQLDSPPLILFPPALAGAEAYAHLAYLLDGKVPMIALDSYHLHSGEPWKPSIEALASYYIEVLDRENIQKPFILGGWSLGGNIAFEVAQQLGEQSYPLLFLDSYNLPEADTKISNMFVNMRRMISVAPKHIAAYYASLSKTQSQHLINSLKHDLKMLSQYQAKPYHGKIIALKAMQKIIVNFHRKSLNRNGWNEVCRDVEVVQLDVNHQRMMYEGEVEKVAAALEAAYYRVIGIEDKPQRVAR